jgi:hypothetical protein
MFRDGACRFFGLFDKKSGWFERLRALFVFPFADEA